MQFNSIDFLFFFLPIFLVAYYVVPDRWRNAILIAGSISFYSQAGSNKHLILGLLIGCTLVTFVVARLLEKPRRGWVLTLALCSLAGLLMFFKLYNEGRFLPAGLSFLGEKVKLSMGASGLALRQSSKLEFRTVIRYSRIAFVEKPSAL